MASLVLWIVFFPLYLVLRSTSGNEEYGDELQPQLLANGDILVPVEEGRNTVRLRPGGAEHAAWLARVQRQR